MSSCATMLPFTTFSRILTPMPLIDALDSGCLGSSAVFPAGSSLGSSVLVRLSYGVMPSVRSERTYPFSGFLLFKKEIAYHICPSASDLSWSVTVIWLPVVSLHMILPSTGAFLILTPVPLILPT